MARSGLKICFLFALVCGFVNPPSVKPAPVPIQLRRSGPKIPLEMLPEAAKASQNSRPFIPQTNERKFWRNSPDIKTRFFVMDCDQWSGAVHCDDPACEKHNRCVYVQWSLDD